MRLLGSHLRRLVRRPASWITLGMLAAMIALVFIALGASAEQAAAQPGGEAILQLLAFPLAYTFVLAFVIQIGSLFAVIYFAAVAGSEWNWGTFKNAVARGESRSRYVVSTYVALGLLTGVGLLVVFLVGVLAAIVGAQISGVGLDGIGDQDALLGLPNQAWRAWLALAEAGAIGFAFATLARSPLAGVGAGIALFFVEEFAGLLLPDVVRWLPFNAAAAVIAGADMSGIQGGGGRERPRSGGGARRRPRLAGRLPGGGGGLQRACGDHRVTAETAERGASTRPVRFDVLTPAPADGSTRARLGRLETPHGGVQTPMFMPVGTNATVKALDPDDLAEVGAQIILANTYHLYLRPGHERIARLGGLHRFMGWDRPILTDSGGFQVVSLGDLRVIDEDGATFRSHLDGSTHRFTPEHSIAVQEALGPDIAVAFDQPVPPHASTRAEVAEATARTHRWAERSLAAHDRPDQALFGIIQGGLEADLRAESTRAIAAHALRRPVHRRPGR